MANLMQPSGFMCNSLFQFNNSLRERERERERKRKRERLQVSNCKNIQY